MKERKGKGRRFLFLKRFRWVLHRPFPLPNAIDFLHLAPFHFPFEMEGGFIIVLWACEGGDLHRRKRSDASRSIFH